VATNTDYATTDYGQAKRDAQEHVWRFVIAAIEDIDNDGRAAQNIIEHEIGDFICMRSFPSALGGTAAGSLLDVAGPDNTYAIVGI